MEEKNVDFYHALRCIDEETAKLHKEINERMGTLKEIIKILESKYSEKKNNDSEAKEKALKMFLEETPKTIVNEAGPMRHWSKQTGKSEEELIQLRLQHTGQAVNKTIQTPSVDKGGYC